MGCDIHPYVERFDGGRWVAVPSPFIDNLRAEWKNHADPLRWPDHRDYDLFDALAGVRARGPVPRNTTKGMPVDVSADVLAEFIDWGSDAHSASHMDGAEFCAIVDDLYPDSESRPDDLFGANYPGFAEGLRSLTGQVRVVFWFDN